MTRGSSGRPQDYFFSDREVPGRDLRLQRRSAALPGRGASAARSLEFPPDADDGGNVLVVERVGAVPLQGFFEGPGDLGSVTTPVVGEADERDPPVGLVSAALQVPGVNEILHQSRCPGWADADEPAGQRADRLGLTVLQ